ncbi:hypothetical protein [Listeria valentina]|uniref:hypothetical protein n=1 Tax=Listeria valentina TaxID=2705293 RepID=UPI00143158C7|nr:hypothetical protein [Listeria valentina]
MTKAKYYNFPDEDYYALIKAENEEKAKKIYVDQVSGDDVSEIGKVLEISESEARKQWDEAEKYAEEKYDEKFDDSFEGDEINCLLLIDSYFA